MLNLGKYNLLGLQVNAIDYEAATALIIQAAQNHQNFTVAAQPVHGVMTSVLDRKYRYRLNQFDLVCPDGQPVRWALNLLYKTQMQDRVYGPTLTLKICQAAAETGVSIFLYGSKPEVLKQLQTHLKRQFPNLKIAGAISPPFRPLSAEEEQGYLEEIRQSQAGILFVGLGCPRQEHWAYEHRHQLNCAILCVGAAFDFHAGNIPQAPPWMQRGGLEWLFRLFQEPLRLWKRYVLLNPLYLILLFLQTLKILPVQRWARTQRY
jgi:exopolysaccharide biosynthesis WecB/TagA/CpsF family protein